MLAGFGTLRTQASQDEKTRQAWLPCVAAVRSIGCDTKPSVFEDRKVREKFDVAAKELDLRDLRAKAPDEDPPIIEPTVLIVVVLATLVG